MTDLEDSFVTNIDGLAAHYAKPAERVLKKRFDHVNAVGRAFIAASPFLVLAPSRCEPQAPLRCQRQGARDSDGRDGRTGISALPKGAGPVRSVEGGKWRPATRRADAG